ncbi:MAG: alanine--tRNA ligase [Candidatus Competibacteraceae bacterium]|jgi:alanyl-tRNA synthetase|nr:alanine--tRNA ligase [Candidatus Competibacteraceae bacterium]
MISSAELRTLFQEFFQGRGHEIVASSPLVPANDPTLLFTNAGMVQFKDVFLGREQRPYNRAVSSQRCVRAGGKHNDLENVGYTARHHTFFEMLGNFSFGDYFKEEAIRFAWDFLVDVLKLPPEKLWITVFEEDPETEKIWLEIIGADPARFSRIGAKDNFWQMGDTGPCGPCSEIFYDHGPEVPGGPPGSPDEDGDRYIEIWNLVFMQYNRSADGNLTPLPKPSVDTGMGLERLAAVMQGVHSNYEIDLFRNLIQAVAEVTGTTDLNHNSLKVIADHIRSTAFMIVDGVLPDREGRGYVLRRIMRRAIRHGYTLGTKGAFLYRLIKPLVVEMGAAYPELVSAEPQVTRVIAQEEERFAETLEHGLHLLEQDIRGLSNQVIPGKTVFRLYDTFGFPVDLTADIARERGLSLDMAGFEQAMEAQRTRARAASQFGVQHDQALTVEERTEFSGYERLEDQVTVTALFRDGQPIDILQQGEKGLVVLERTPFYAESGGQVGDTGRLVKDNGEFQVDDTRKQGDGAYIHNGLMQQGELRVGDPVSAQVDQAKRRATELNHSATHLLHAALRQVLGTHVTQKGSLVEPSRLRFDFSHFEPVTPAQLQDIEHLVNTWVRANAVVETRLMPIETALESGALALFGEKYDPEVRVLSMGAFSTELCGGTHVQRLGDIGLFKITAEGGVAAGVRRIEAVTGDGALDYVNNLQHQLHGVAQLIKGERDSVTDKVQQLVEKGRRLEKELEQLKAKLASEQGSELADQAIDINGIKVLAARLDGADVKTLRDTVDQLKNKLKAAAIVLAAVENDKVRLVAGVTASETQRLKAGELVNLVAQQVGGKGGGRADMAQAGGADPTHLEAALSSVPEWVKAQLS